MLVTKHNPFQRVPGKETLAPNSYLALPHEVASVLGKMLSRKRNQGAGEPKFSVPNIRESDKTGLPGQSAQLIFLIPSIRDQVLRTAPKE